MYNDEWFTNFSFNIIINYIISIIISKILINLAKIDFLYINYIYIY